MKHFLLIACSILLSWGSLSGQSLYFPQNTPNASWDTLPADQLGFSTFEIDSLNRFLKRTNGKSFILLQDGKRALETYFDSYTKDSLWYWASAGKTMTAFLVGIAQQEGLLDIDMPTSTYLGRGWTSLTPAQEDSITVWHQLSMTSGLDDGIAPTTQVPDPLNCLDSACLQYLAPAGSRWSYHNAPYRLLLDVIENVSGQNPNVFTFTRLYQPTGIRGFWSNYVQFGKARDMARFGLLMQGKGSWDGTPILQDTTYFNQLARPSQSLNNSYGYLWWLNGQPSFMLPQVQFTFPGSLVPAAPADMYAALGKNDQKIYVVPSLGWVVVRQGNSATTSAAGPSSFDNELWKILMWMRGATGVDESVQTSFHVYPNPVSGSEVIIQSEELVQQVELMSVAGKFCQKLQAHGNQWTLDRTQLTPGLYFLRITSKRGTSVQKLVIK